MIPSWIKITAKFWTTDKITDKDFVTGIQYLIKNKIVKIPQGKLTDSKTNMIPDWVKKSAGSWADGKITDNEFANGLQFLISNGIIKLKS